MGLFKKAIVAGALTTIFGGVASIGLLVSGAVAAPVLLPVSLGLTALAIVVSSASLYRQHSRSSPSP